MHSRQTGSQNSQWGAVLGVWGQSPQPPEANGGLGAKPPAAGGWGFGGKAPSRRRLGIRGQSPQSPEAGDSGAKPPVTGGWEFGGKAPSRRGLGAEPLALENFAFFCKNNLF